MKSYTDLEQSKKLVEFLPIESADMNYSNMCYKGVMYSNPYSAGLTSYNDASRMNQENIDFYLKGVDYKGVIAWDVLPCWSLAALLNILRNYTLQTNTDGTVFVVCESKKPMISDAYDNPIDACVAMIIKLHELKRL